MSTFPMFVRHPSILHRSAIAAADKVAGGGVITPLIGVTPAGGSLAFAETYFATICPRNAYGPSAPSAIVTASPGGANTGLRVLWAAVTGATHYDLFLSVDAQPLHVGSCTEAQRAAGGILVAENGAIGAGGTAGGIDIGVVGTGLAPNVAPYIYNNAYRPTTVAEIDCRKSDFAVVYVTLAVTDLRSLPTLVLVPFMKDDQGAWHQCDYEDMTPLTALHYSLDRTLEIETVGAAAMVVLVGTITGAGATATIRVELA